MKSIPTAVSRRLALVCIAFCLITAPGCSVTRFASSSWIEVKTPSFDFLSNIDRMETIELAKALEIFRGLLRSLIGSENVRSGRSVRVFIFDGIKDFEKFHGDSRMAGYFFGNPRGDVAAIAGGKSVDKVRVTNRILHIYKGTARVTLFHEYVHHLLHISRIDYPLWYEEGLAQLLSTVKINGARAEIGEAPPGLQGYFFYGGEYFPMSELLDIRYLAEVKEKYHTTFYANSWAWVHFLTLGHVLKLKGKPLKDRRAQLTKYLEYHNRGLKHEDAFCRAFETTLDQIQREFKAYAAVAGVKSRFPAEDLPKSIKFSVRKLEPSAIALALGELSWKLGKQEQALLFFGEVPENAAEYTRARAAMGRIRTEQGKFEKAEKIFSSLPMQDAKEPLVVIDYGWHFALKALAIKETSQEKKTYFKRARKQFKKAFGLDPYNVEAASLFATTYLDCTEDVTPAMDAVKKALVNTSWHPILDLVMAQLYLCKKDPKTALEHLLIVLKHHKRNDDISKEARALYQKHSPKKADPAGETNKGSRE